MRNIKNMKKQGNMTTLKVNSTTVKDTKDSEEEASSHKEFKSMVIRIFNK
jgi:hypothetical protein